MTRKLSSVYQDFAKTHANPDTDGNSLYHRAVQAHSAKADQNPYVLRTPGILENVLERGAKPNCFCNFININSFNWASSQNVPEHHAKSNLDPPLRA